PATNRRAGGQRHRRAGVGCGGAVEGSPGRPPPPTPGRDPRGKPAVLIGRPAVHQPGHRPDWGPRPEAVALERRVGRPMIEPASTLTEAMPSSSSSRPAEPILHVDLDAFYASV